MPSLNDVPISDASLLAEDHDIPLRERGLALIKRGLSMIREDDCASLPRICQELYRLMPELTSGLQNNKGREVIQNKMLQAYLDEKRGRHGQDGSHGHIEQKSGRLKHNSLTPHVGIGMYDKIHSRVDAPAFLTAQGLHQLRIAAKASLGEQPTRKKLEAWIKEKKIACATQEGDRAIIINSARRARLLVDRLAQAGWLSVTKDACDWKEGGKDVEWPPTMANGALNRYQHTGFALYSGRDDLYPPIAMFWCESEALEELGPEVEKMYEKYLERSAQIKASGGGHAAHDGFTIKMQHLMKLPPEKITLIHLDVDYLKRINAKAKQAQDSENAALKRRTKPLNIDAEVWAWLRKVASKEMGDWMDSPSVQEASIVKGTVVSSASSRRRTL